MIKCPNCGESHYQYHYSTTTAMGWIQEYKDGIPVNSNPNISTSYCTCCECGHDFYYTEQYGEVQSIVDQGKRPEVPTINVSINAPSAGEVLKARAKDVLFMPSKKETTITIPNSKDLDEINKKLERLTKMVESLWEWNTHDVFPEEEM